MGQGFVAGPCLIYAGTGSGKAAVPFCVCEDSPQVQVNAEWEPLFNAFGGCRLPADTTFQGEDALVRIDATWWNEPVMAAVQSRPFTNGVRGFFPFGAIGTLMQTEGAAYPLWLKLPAQAKPAYAAMPPGYRFLSAFLEGPDDLGPLSAKPRKVSLIFRCRSVLNPANLSWTLYDHLGFGALPRFQ